MYTPICPETSIRTSGVDRKNTDRPRSVYVHTSGPICFLSPEVCTDVSGQISMFQIRPEVCIDTSGVDRYFTDQGRSVDGRPQQTSRTEIPRYVFSGSWPIEQEEKTTPTTAYAYNLRFEDLASAASRRPSVEKRRYPSISVEIRRSPSRSINFRL